MTDKLVRYLTEGTQETKTAASIGLEVETDYLNRQGQPPTEEQARLILATTDKRPKGCSHKLELGRQKFEVSVAPQPTFALAYEATPEALDWLNAVVLSFSGGYPQYAPEVSFEACPGNLLFVQEERDEVWVNLDGRRALEELTRCSSVQYTISVSPKEAIVLLNHLQAAKVHEWDYAANHRRWLNYIQLSAAGYPLDRYGGSESFESLAEYCGKLAQYPVVMHQGQPMRQHVDAVVDLNTDLFLRSVWWHYRLRRYDEILALEIRPFARRSDEAIRQTWERLAHVLEISEQTTRVMPKYQGVR